MNESIHHSIMHLINPYLSIGQSVKNLCFLLLFRNLQGDTQLLRAKMDAAQQPSPPRHRLRHRLSSPVLTYPRRLSSPAAYENERLRSSSTSQVSDVLHPSKLAVPSRVPPLDFHRGLTPEPRSRDSPDLTQGKLSLVQEVIDLGKPQSFLGNSNYWLSILWSRGLGNT